MEPATAPLRLISRKFFRPFQKKPASNGPKPVSKNWLRPTVAADGVVLPRYRQTLEALHNLTAHQEAIRDFRIALKSQDFLEAESLWARLRQSVEPQSQNCSDLSSWKKLADSTGSYGPRIFMNALNDISRHGRNSPDLVHRLIMPSHSALDPYILGHVLSRLGHYGREEEAIDLLRAENAGRSWTDDARVLGLTALLEASEMKGAKIMRILKRVNPPTGYKLPSYLVARLAKQSGPESVDALKALIDHDILKPTKSVDQLLRRLYSSSDYGALTIHDYASKTAYPWQFYPFLVRRLCERLSHDPLAKDQLDHLFDNEIAELASTKPSLVLHLLVLRIIATDGVQATSPVLNRWVETDQKGVNESTWLLLFQAFRRMGRPDKCSEVLARVLQTRSKLSLPFVGEYLLYTAQFHNLDTYLSVLTSVIPEFRPLLKALGIFEYVESLTFRAQEQLGESPRLVLTPDNRDFAVHRIHESWLAITYQAVLATAESSEQIYDLFWEYIRYVTETSRNPSTSLRVVDQFIFALCGLPGEQNGLETAENVLRIGLDKLKLKIPVDGKNHSKSLELLCFKMVQSRQPERAVQLLVDAVAKHGMVLRETALAPWISRLPEKFRGKLMQWAQNHAGVVAQHNLSHSNKH